MSSQPAPASQHDATALLGPILIGWMVHLLCYGVIVGHLSAYTSSQTYRKDPRVVKLLMWLVFAAETAQIGLDITRLLRFGTTQDRSVDSLLGSSLADVLAPVPSGFVALVVQSFLLSRALSLLGHTPAGPRASARWRWRWRWRSALGAVVVGCPIVLGYMSSIWLALVGFNFIFRGEIDQVGPAFSLSYNAALGIWLWCAAAVDVTVSTALVVLLRRQVSGVADSRMDSVLRGLMKLGVRTGAYTALLATAGAVTATAFPGIDIATTNLNEAFWPPLSGFYTLSLLATLASRAHLNETLAGPGPAHAHAHAEPAAASTFLGHGFHDDGRLPKQDSAATIEHIEMTAAARARSRSLQ